MCEIVGVEFDKKEYCRLGREEQFKSHIDFLFGTSNWYDTIGWLIASENKSFEEILDYYREPMEKYIGQDDGKGGLMTFESIYPFHTKVIYSWMEKGYVPKQIHSF